jgi:hypothetical protein
MPTYLSNIAFAGGAKVTGLPLTGFNAQDAVPKSYVDSVAQGLSTKDAARAATLTVLPACTYAPGTGSGTGAGVGATLTATANGLFPLIDGVDIASFVSNPDAYHLARVLVKNQADSKQNGIYQLTTAGADDPSGSAWVLTRSTDANTGLKLAAGSFVFVEEGTQSATGYVMNTSDPITLGTSLINWALFSDTGAISAGIALTKTLNVLDVRTDGVTIGVTTHGTPSLNNNLYVLNSGIAALQLATNAVETAKINAGAVSAAKLNADIPGVGLRLAVAGDVVAGTVLNSVVVADLYRVKRYAATVVGDDINTYIDVGHNLVSSNVLVQVRLGTALVQVDAVATNANSVRLQFAAVQLVSDSYAVSVVALPSTPTQP